MSLRVVANGACYLKIFQHGKLFMVTLGVYPIWEKVLAELVKKKRLQEGRNAHPSLLIIDAQSVKTTGKGEQRGFDGEKKLKGANDKLLWIYLVWFIKYWCTKPISMIQKEVLF